MKFYTVRIIEHWGLKLRDNQVLGKDRGRVPESRRIALFLDWILDQGKKLFYKRIRTKIRFVLSYASWVAVNPELFLLPWPSHLNLLFCKSHSVSIQCFHMLRFRVSVCDRNTSEVMQAVFFSVSHIRRHTRSVCLLAVDVNWMIW